MKLTMELKILQPEELGQAVDVAKGVFDYCLRKGITQPEAIRFFEEYAQEEKLRRMMEEGRLVVWGIFTDGQLCAMSAMQTEGHITMLYVLPVYQRRGMGKTLLRTMRSYAGEHCGQEQVTVSAMPVWTAGYFEKAGFRRMEGQINPVAPYLFLCAKTIREVRYPKKPIRESALIGIISGFLAVIFLVAFLFFFLQ